MRTIAEDIIRRAVAHGILIATAESCTAGMVAAAITDVPGASAAFDRGFVVYTNAAKRELLGVDARTLSRFGAVSEDVAAEMAEGAQSHSDADLTIAITGIAGPGGSDFKPEGRVCFALALSDDVRSYTVDFGALGRTQVRKAATEHALSLLAEALS